MAKINKILIANRGEIACRVMKTARKMGIQTVAVYSDADRKALHVRTADEAVYIGPSPAIESYLVIDKIIDACKQSGADAVHPGYGFLSENAEFARRLKKEGIVFIGPTPESMDAMGLKDAAKKLMEKAGVPVTPGYHGKDQDPQLLKAKAGMIGYPVLIKAVAGGGGKGMRKVDAEGDFLDALASCQREAHSSFGNDVVLIEKYILSPRHIEVQVFGDQHGNVVHMYERDCSLQRRHQKVIEEAPAPGMTEDVRRAMTKAAIEAAKAVNYEGAGTVEFIVDGSGKLRTDGFWFMEMNTRLQVEHPVTELITGLDLVELQIRVAQGEKLPEQKDISLYGHAVEARLYAEDPANDFLPSIGRIWSMDDSEYRDSEGGFRIDTGVSSKDNISVYYDPMIAKVIGYSHEREAAILQAEHGLVEIQVSGLTTNISFLLNCLRNPVFIKGDISTGFIEEQSSTLIAPDLNQCDEILALSALRLEAEALSNTHNSPFDQRKGWRLNQARNASYYFQRDDEPIRVCILESNEKYANVQIDDNEPLRISFLEASETFTNITQSLTYYCEWAYAIRDDHISLFNDGVFAQAYFYDPASETLSVNAGDTITSPMPGKILAVNVKTGDTVTKGDKLIIMEAMKMEMSLEAPRDGVVSTVNCKVDALVTDGELLLELEEKNEEKS